jgi:hypothetical protein
LSRNNPQIVSVADNLYRHAGATVSPAATANGLANVRYR